MLHTPAQDRAVAASVVRVPRQRQSYDEQADGERGARGRRPRGRVGRIAVLLPVLLCGIAALAGAATLGAVAVASAEHSRHEFRTPGESGSLVVDATAGTALTSRAQAAEEGFRERFGTRLRSVTSAVYSHDSPTSGAPSGALVFVGAAIDTAGDPHDFVSAFSTAARRSGYTVQRVSAGSGAEGVCMARGVDAATCAWSTGDSVGQLVPAVDGWRIGQLAKAMRTLRADSEYTSQQ